MGGKATWCSPLPSFFILILLRKHEYIYLKYSIFWDFRVQLPILTLHNCFIIAPEPVISCIFQEYNRWATRSIQVHSLIARVEKHIHIKNQILTQHSEEDMRKFLPESIFAKVTWSCESAFGTEISCVMYTPSDNIVVLFIACMPPRLENNPIGTRAKISVQPFSQRGDRAMWSMPIKMYMSEPPGRLTRRSTIFPFALTLGYAVRDR